MPRVIRKTGIPVLTPYQRILLFLRSRGEAPQPMIKDVLGLSQGEYSYAVDVLTQYGMVEKEHGDRHVVVKLTRRGAMYADMLLNEATQLYTENWVPVAIYVATHSGLWLVWNNTDAPDEIKEAIRRGAEEAHSLADLTGILGGAGLSTIRLFGDGYAVLVAGMRRRERGGTP